jgi:hypothetical protein
MEKQIKKASRKSFKGREEALRISLAPFIFQASRILKASGILTLIKKKGGISREKIAKKVKISLYSLNLLLEAACSIGLVNKVNRKYAITETGDYILTDEITKVYMDFSHDVCYQGLFHLKESLERNKPAGLKVFGDWENIYQAIPSLPKNVQKSWFNFDQYFSDMAFSKALPVVFKNNPQKILDIGGNTGKWALACIQYSEDVSVTIIDLPDTLKKAKEFLKPYNADKRISFQPMELLDHSNPFPKGFDTIWMSQFLDCFGEQDIVQLVKRAADIMDENSSLFVLEPYVDRQFYGLASLCLCMTSLYFTCMANGNSRMYHAGDMKRLINQAGLTVLDDIDNISISHTLFRCQKKKK